MRAQYLQGSGPMRVLHIETKAVSFMEFAPPLAYSKKHALDTLFYFDSVKIFLVFSRPFWSEPNNLPIIPYNSSTQQNGASAISDDLARVVRTTFHSIQLSLNTTFVPPI